MSNYIPAKVQAAAMFIDQMNGDSARGQSSFTAFGPPETVAPPGERSKAELSAYNAAMFVMYGYFTGEMLYEEPILPNAPPAIPPGFGPGWLSDD